MFRRAAGAERRALMRFLQALQNLTRNAFFRFSRLDSLDGEDLFRIVVCILGAECVPAVRNLADAAPVAIRCLKHLRHQLSGGHIPFAPDGAGILILHFHSSLLQLPNSHIHALQDINGLESGDDDGRLVASRFACHTAMAFAGAVVSNPTPKNTTLFSGQL